MRDDNKHHEELEARLKLDRAGRYLLAWQCTCGAKGTGATSAQAAHLGWVKHMGFSATPRSRSSSPAPLGW